MECWICGQEATIGRSIGSRIEGFYSREETQRPTPYKRCYCKRCFEQSRAEYQEKKTQLVRLKKDIMFETAMDILEHQHYDFYKNKEAIEVVQEKIQTDPDKFDSSYEVITAIILVSNEMYSRMQYKIGTYQVDFLLPDHHLILEIDGDRHRYNKGKDSVRDEHIKKMLGPDWEIIRIPTELIKKDAKQIPKAIRNVLAYRQSGKMNWRKVYE